jgi:asparagine synthetase B (glutamine-hydrolysing)
MHLKVKRLFKMGGIIAVVNKSGDDAIETAVTMLKMLAHRNESFGIASPNKISVGKSVEALQNLNAVSPIAIGHAFSKSSPYDKPQPTKLENATLVFEGRIHPTRNGISDGEAVAQKLQNSGEGAESLVRESNGCFAFAIAKKERVVAGRDSIGVYPYYYGESKGFAVLASERKALWKIGMKKVNSFPPGHVAFVDMGGFKWQPVKTLKNQKPKQTTMSDATRELQELLQKSVSERVKGLSEVAVAFSGGLDSSIIAVLAKNLCANVHLIHVSLANQEETAFAKTAAEELKLPLHGYLYDEKDVEKILPEALWLIEEPNPIKASIGIPFYWIAEKTAEMNLRVLLAGQGADELFGGYKRYVEEYLRYGSEKARRIIFSDILKMYENNLERDFKICNFHNLELRLPFVTDSMLKFATELPLNLKIEKKEHGLRKLVLRQVAHNLGLSKGIVEKPKKAIQYTTGADKVLKRLAASKGLTVTVYLQKTFQAVLKRLN